MNKKFLNIMTNVFGIIAGINFTTALVLIFAYPAENKLIIYTIVVGCIYAILFLLFAKKVDNNTLEQYSKEDIANLEPGDNTMKIVKFGKDLLLTEGNKFVYLKYIPIAFIILLSSCSMKETTSPLERLNSTATHKCKFKLCPYKGVQKMNAKKAVLLYTECEEGTDCFAIDMLHFIAPNKNYEALERMLFED